MKNHRSGSAPSAAGGIAVGFLEYALVFTAIIECNSLFHYSENYRQTTLEIVVTVFAVLLAGLLAAVVICRRRGALREDLRRCWPVGAALLLCILAFFGLNVLRLGADNALRKYCLSFILFLPLAYLLFRGYRQAGEPNKLLFRHADLVTVIAVCNLIVYGAVTLRPELIQTQLMNSRWSGQGSIIRLLNYLDLFCVSPSRTRTIAGFTLYRNMGFFAEPLMFCVQLITALFTEMFLRKKGERRLWRWVVLILAVFTSQSTLGMLLAAGAVGLKLVEGAGPKRRKAMLAPALLIVAAAVLVLLRQKSDADSGHSTAAHIQHYLAAFRTFLEHPLLGCGYLREESILQHLPGDFLSRSHGLSNSVAVVLAEGGVLLGLLCMVPFFLGLAQLRSRGSRRVVLWTLGPLGLYCATVFHFHLLLMLFMAFGYAQLELVPAEGGKRRLILAEDGGAPSPRDPLTAPQRIGRTAALLLGCCAAGGLFLSGGLWQAVSRWLRLHQLYLGQSAWKVYFFALFLILAVLTVRQVLRAWGRKDAAWLPEAVWFLGYSLLFAALYPRAYTGLSTILDRPTAFGDLFESAALAVLYFGGVALGWGVVALGRRNRRLLPAGAAAVLLLAAGTAAGISRLASGGEAGISAAAPALQAAVAAAEGKVYANERPAVLRRAIPGLACSPARDGAFAALENASVVAAHDRDLRDLTSAGFSVTELSPEYVLYTNDEAVMLRLREEGFVFSAYYPYPLAMDNEAARILSSGSYTLTAGLELEEAAEGTVCSIEVRYNYGEKTVKRLQVSGEEFEDGRCTVLVPFNAGNWEGMEYSVLPAEGVSLRVLSLTLAETPAYLTETAYDGRHLAVREAYFLPDGEPYRLPRGYAAMTTDYDRAGRIIGRTYLDEQGAPVLTSYGYASFTREFNRQGRLRREAYFGEQGSPCLLKEGYAALEREYDRWGNVVLLRYCGTDGQPVTTALGYAECRSVYDRKRRLLEQSYFDDGGAPVLLPEGYASETREYDEAGNLALQEYFDAAGQPALTAMGYARIRRTYDEQGRVVREEYFGVQGERIALPGGEAAAEIEYGADGKAVRRYFGPDGEELSGNP